MRASCSKSCERRPCSIEFGRSRPEQNWPTVIAENIAHFARILRAAGMPVGPDRILAAIAAVETVGLDRRDDVHAALSAVMLDRHEQQHLFDAAFAAFWRDPKWLEMMMAALLPKVGGRRELLSPPRPNRLSEALAAPHDPNKPASREAAEQDEIRFDAVMSMSERERIQSADFESMTAAEFVLAQRLAERVPLPVRPVQRRRHEAAARGKTNLRATLLRQVRQPHTLVPAFTRPRRELPSLVVLLDVSGSMDRYARLFLHYVHGLMRRHLRVSIFTFGTRLTNITRCLAHRDPDVALALAGEQVKDWKGGTRIATSLEQFNRVWARRVLGGNAALLLVSDGLDRDEQGELGRAAAQLKRLAHEVVWLNPLLRFARFEPKAAGMRALLPHVDRFLPVHSLDSLADLGAALRRPSASPASLLR
jgi:uncharacterized protein